MTRSLRDEWGPSSADDGPPETPQHVQDEVSALLRRSAQEPAPAMPSDVEARLRAALSAEFGAAFDASTASNTRPTSGDAPPETRSRAGASTVDVPRVVALPARRTTADGDATRSASEPVGHASEAHTTADAASGVRASDHRASSQDTGATVVSLTDRRARRKRVGGAVIALGAAAAVAFGVVTMTQSHKNEAPVAGAEPSATGGVAQNYASRVRVTQSEAKYEAASLVKQAATLPGSKEPEVPAAMANSQSLGPLGTGEGVQTCLDAVAPTLSKEPDRVYADFGTYEGKRAVVIVAQTGEKSTVWVVSATCTVHSDLKAGPKDLTT